MGHADTFMRLLQGPLCNGASAARHIPEPELKFAKAVFAHHHQRFFTGTGYVQQVTDQKNKNYKKPHRKHIASFISYFSNTVPITAAILKIMHTE
jgi:hypothetical protein